MNSLLDKLKRKITLVATEACAYRENIKVISEEEMKKILEKEFANFVPDINVGDKNWIPVTERLPGNNDNVRVTVIRNGKPAVAVGWYNHDKGKWKVCLCHEDEFLYQHGNSVIAWKENNDDPYQPGDNEKFSKRTNADRIRAMTDEELAVLLMCPYDTAGNTEDIMPCVLDDDNPDFVEPGKCKGCALKWLKREVSSD